MSSSPPRRGWREKTARLERSTREVVVVVLVAGSEKAAAHRLGLALDRQAPRGERAFEGRRDNDGATRMDVGRVCPMPRGKRRGSNIRYRALTSRSIDAHG